MRSIVIPHDENLPIFETQIHEEDELLYLQEAVGGYIESVQVAQPRNLPKGVSLAAYINEDGKAKGLPVNRRATTFWHMMGVLREGDYIVGNLVLAGYDDMGDSVALPEEFWPDLPNGDFQPDEQAWVVESQA
jgi:hypothetical protein